MKEGIAESLARIDKIPGRQERIDALRQDHSIGMENIVDLCFNENITWLLPEGVPTYKKQVKEMDLQHVLYSQIRKLGIFINTGNYFLKRWRLVRPRSQLAVLLLTPYSLLLFKTEL